MPGRSVKSRRGRSDEEPSPSNGHRVDAREASGGLNMHRQVSRHPRPGERIQVTTPHSSRAGTVTFEGDYATITFERRIRHPIQVVWEALTESEHLARWYMTKARLDAREDELDGVPLVDWRTRVEEVRANYPGWDARR